MNAPERLPAGAVGESADFAAHPTLGALVNLGALGTLFAR